MFYETAAFLQGTTNLNIPYDGILIPKADTINFLILPSLKNKVDDFPLQSNTIVEPVSSPDLEGQ